MIIVLIVSSIFMSLSIFLYQGFHINDKEMEKSFWVSFNYRWKQAIENSEYNNEPTYVYINNHQVVFSNKGHHVNLSMPDSLFAQERFLVIIKEDGYIAPKTYRWFSKKTNTVYLMKVQLGGGTYKLNEEYYD